MLGARKVRHDRRRARGDQDFAGGYGAAARERDFVRTGDGGALVDSIEVVTPEILRVQPFDTRYYVTDSCANGRTAEISVGHLTTETERQGELLGGIGLVHEDVFL